MKPIFKTRMQKGISQLVPLILFFVVAVIVASISGQILGQIQSTQTSNSVPYNVTGKGLSGLTTIGDFFPTIATVVAAVVVIGLVLAIGMQRKQ